MLGLTEEVVAMEAAKGLSDYIRNLPQGSREYDDYCQYYTYRYLDWCKLGSSEFIKRCEKQREESEDIRRKYPMTNKELQAALSKYPDDAVVYLEDDLDHFFIKSIEVGHSRIYGEDLRYIEYRSGESWENYKSEVAILLKGYE